MRSPTAGGDRTNKTITTSKKKPAGRKTALEICTELMCCHKSEQEAQDLLQIGHVEREKEHSATAASKAVVSTATSEEDLLE